MNTEQEMLGKRLKLFRNTIGWTRRHISEKYGFAARSVQSWEDGSKNINAITLAQYIKIFEPHGLKVSLDRLLDFDNKISINKIIEIA